MPLKVRTFIASSPIHGLGLYAAEAISAQHVIWGFEPPDYIISLTSGQRNPWFSYEFRCFVETYGCMQREPGGDSFWLMCSDDAKFMNHAAEPNSEKLGTILQIASRDIAAGEEITCNYAQWCLMGAPA